MSIAEIEPLNLPLDSVARKRIQESEDFWFETFGWMRSGSTEESKSLPYHDQDSLFATYRIGAKIFHETMLGKVIHENLLSYIVGTGHTYAVKALTDEDGEDATTVRAMRAIDRFMASREWPDDQEEFYNRWFRSGDTLRVVELAGRSVEYSYVEPFHLRKPESGRLTRDGKVVAPFGIEYDGGNVNRPNRYWLQMNDRDRPQPFPRWSNRRVILHGKRGVDRNDPRGIPLLWVAYCVIKEIEELHSHLSRIMASVSNHSVVYDYNPDTSNEAIFRVAEGATADAQVAAMRGKLSNNPGGAHHARDHKVVLNGAQLNANGWVEALQSKIRYVGVLASLPEFIVTGDAETGSRNTLFAAEAPFTRRISREARRGAAHEIELLYQVVAAELGFFGDPDKMAAFRQSYRILPEFPIAESRDKTAETSRVISALERELISPQMASAELGHEYEDVQRDIETHLDRMAARRERGLGGFADPAKDLEFRLQLAQSAISKGIPTEDVMDWLGLDADEFGPMVQPPTLPLIPDQSVA